MSKTDLSTFNNSWYNPGSRFKIGIWYIINVLLVSPRWNIFSNLKILILKCFGANIGKGVLIKPGVYIKFPWKLTIGNHCWIGENVWIDNLDQVILEDHVCISQGAFLECGNHNYKKQSFDLMTGPITLKEGSWVGAQARIAPGVTIESHAILTMGSTAVNNLAPYNIYSGNPASFKKKRVIENKPVIQDTLI